MQGKRKHINKISDDKKRQDAEILSLLSVYRVYRCGYYFDLKYVSASAFNVPTAPVIPVTEVLRQIS